MAPSAMSTPKRILAPQWQSCYVLFTVLNSQPITTAPRPDLQARKQQFVRDAIQDAAIDLFAEKGFDETTVDDIALAAGVSRRSFFRYFSSKSDLMAHGILSYGNVLTDAIDACPRHSSISELFEETVLRVARHQAAQPRTRKIMQIAAKYQGAREAQLSRVAEVHDKVAEAFARQMGIRRPNKPVDGLTANLLAGLTLTVLGTTFHSWLGSSPQDISVTVEQVFAALGRVTRDEAPKKHKR